MLSTVNPFFYYLKPICILSLIFFLSNTSIFGQPKQIYGWEEELSKAKGSDRIDLILTLSEDLLGEDLTMADSLAREGINLAKELGDSLSIYRMGGFLGNVLYHRNELEKGIGWIQKSLNYYEKDKNLAYDKAKIQLTLAGFYIKKENWPKRIV